MTLSRRTPFEILESRFTPESTPILLRSRCGLFPDYRFSAYLALKLKLHFEPAAKAWLPESLFSLWKVARPRDLGRVP